MEGPAGNSQDQLVGILKLNLKAHGNLMKWEKTVKYATASLILLRGNIIVGNADCKILPLLLILNRLVCGSCSGNSWYVPGYADQKVRMCDQCYKEWMAYKVSSHNINKTSVFSSYFGNNLNPNNPP